MNMNSYMPIYHLIKTDLWGLPLNVQKHIMAAVNMIAWTYKAG